MRTRLLGSRGKGGGGEAVAFRCRRGSDVGGLGFTFVELLVVVAVISILAALLLPALESAVENSRRISCASDKRQLFMAIPLFADDHGQVMPHNGNWDSARGMLVNGSGLNANFGAGGMKDGGSIQPLGMLAALRYAEDPRLYFCNSFVRENKDPSTWWWDQPENRGMWEEFTDGDNSWGMDYRTMCGVAAYWWTGFGVSPLIRRLKYPFIERHCMDEKLTGSETVYGVSALLLSCANYGNDLVGKKTYYNRSHDREGANGAFFDGTVRWIPKSEVRGCPGNLGSIRMQNGYWAHRYNAMQHWAKYESRPGGVHRGDGYGW